MLWDCKECGTLAIADSLEACPACGMARPDPDPGSARTDEDDVRDGLAAPGEADAGEDAKEPAREAAKPRQPGPATGVESRLPKGWEARK